MKFAVSAVAVLGVAVGCAALLGAVRAQVQSTTSESPPSLLTIAGIGERANGVGAGISSVSVSLTPGSAARAVLYGDRATCSVRPADQATNSTYTLAWTLDTFLVSTRDDAMTVDVHWTRRGSPPAAVSERRRQRIQLERGRPYILDLVHIGTEPDSGCERLSVELTFDLVESLDVADALFRYDMWLVHRDPNGRAHTDRLQYVARQGSETEYIFAPLVHGPAAALVSVSSAQTTETVISGTVRARARPEDVRIDLRVQTWRHITGRGESVGEGGTKTLTVVPGETTELVLPAPTRVPAGASSSQYVRQTTAIRLWVTRLR